MLCQSQVSKIICVCVYICKRILFKTFFHCRLLQDTEYIQFIVLHNRPFLLTHFIYGGGGVLVTKPCLDFCNPIDCSLQASLPMGFSRQEYWGGLPFPLPGDLPYPGIAPGSPASPALAGGFFPTEPPGKLI